MNALRAVFVAAIALLATNAELRAQSSQLAAPPSPAGWVKEFGTMWTFDAPPLAYWKARYNFEPDKAWLDHVRLASVRIPGCSASFVSANGLVMTNHHCGRDCTAGASTADSNYIVTGFAAASLTDEKKCANMFADQLESITDVTAQVRAAITGKTPAQQVAQRTAAFDRLQTACAKDASTVCEVVTFYQGGMYSLYTYHRWTDLRLVMAPEGDIAFYGGDPDNFTFPRYDLDLTLLRVYENGQPLHPREFLKWSAAGAADGELVFVTGNPGSTGRLLTVAQMEYLRERDFRKRIDKDPALALKYGSAWTAIATAEKEQAALAPRLQWPSFLGGSNLLNWAGGIVRLPGQSALPDSSRLVQYRGSAPDRLRTMITNGTVDTAFERMALAATFTAWKAALPPTNPVLVAALAYGKGDPDSAAAALMSQTILASSEARRELLSASVATLAISKDPLIRLARMIEPGNRLAQERSARLDATIATNAALIGEAIFAAYGTSLPPDATFTLRISDGVVEGFPMNGTIAPYKTTMFGLYDRSASFDDKDPFKLPVRWANGRDKLDLATPMDFTSTNDIIGGNSGSPVINRYAEVVGLIFDGNIESLPNRFIFTDAVARSVSVSSRAIVEALRKLYDGGRIADELEGR